MWPFVVSRPAAATCCSYSDTGAKYCDEYLHQIFGYVTYDRGSVLLWRHSDTLCTSGVV